MSRALILACLLSGHNANVMQSVNNQGVVLPDIFSTWDVDRDPYNARSTVSQLEGLSGLLSLSGVVKAIRYADCERGADVLFGTLDPDMPVNHIADNCCGWGNERTNTNVLRRAFLKEIHHLSIISGIENAPSQGIALCNRMPRVLNEKFAYEVCFREWSQWTDIAFMQNVYRLDHDPRSLLCPHDGVGIFGGDNCVERSLLGIFGLRQGSLEKNDRPAAQDSRDHTKTGHDPLGDRIRRRYDYPVWLQTREQVWFLVFGFASPTALVAAIAFGLDYVTGRRKRDIPEKAKAKRNR